MSAVAPRVSVLLPTYNRAALLPRAIASVLNQSWRDFELIVVDDASTDDTEAVVRGFVDARIVYHRSPQNRGDAGSRNLAARLARGHYLAFQDSDDEWLPDKLEKQLDCIEALAAECALLGCGVLRVAGSRVDVIRWPLEPAGAAQGWVSTERFLNCPAYLQSVLMRRADFEAAGGFDESLPINSDWELCLRVQAGRRIAALGATLVISYETTGSLSQRDDLRLVALQRTLDLHEAEFAASPRALSQFCHEFALAQLRAGHPAAGRRLAWRALRADWRQPRRWALALASLGGSTGVRRLAALRRLLARTRN